MAERKTAPEDNVIVETVLTKFKESDCQGLDDQTWNEFRSEILLWGSNFKDNLQNDALAIPLLRMKLEVVKKDKIIQEKNKIIQEIIQEKDEIIQEKDEIIQEKDEIIQDMQVMQQTMTIAGLLDLKDPSRFELNNRGTISSHTETNHRPATAERRKFNLCPVPNGEGGKWGGLAKKWKGKSSTLLSLNDSDKPQDYFNEADVQIFVHATVLDAVFICNQMIAEVARSDKIVQKLMVRREASLLSSNKPDHTVIFDAISGIDILTIEDKKPYEKIEDKGKVLGQLHDYLSVLASFGNPHPFGILTTFEQTWVGWIFQEDSQIAASSNKLDFDEVAKLVPNLPRSDGRCTPDSTHTSSTSCSPSSTSSSEKQPLKKANHMVYLSQETFEAHELVPLLCNAIFCGLQDIMAWRQNPLVLSKDVEKHGRFLKLTKDTYDWLEGTLPFTGNPASKPKSEEEAEPLEGTLPFTGNPASKPKSEEEADPLAFIVVQLLGVGETSRAFRAVTMSGDECVIKVYVRKYVGNKPLSNPEFNTAAEESCNREVTNYLKIYGHEVAVWTTVLNGFHCVILPYFEPVQKQNRKEGVAAIETLLTKKFKDLSLVFAESDMSWRHVGKIKDKFYLYDLADLEHLADDNMVDCRIEQHLALLREKIENKSI